MEDFVIGKSQLGAKTFRDPLHAPALSMKPSTPTKREPIITRRRIRPTKPTSSGRIRVKTVK